MNIEIKKGLSEDSSYILCRWSNERGKEFQEQWMGSWISYPLDYEKLKDMENVFSIFDGEIFLGMIQQIRIEKDNVHIGRFIIDPGKQGRGYGKEALKTFIKLIFEEKNINSISLTVFDSNKSAKKVYMGLGFKINEIIETPNLKYIMKLHR